MALLRAVPMPGQGMVQVPSFQGYPLQQRPPQLRPQPQVPLQTSTTPSQAVSAFPQMPGSRGGSMSVQSYAASIPGTPQLPSTPQHGWPSSQSVITLASTPVASTPGNSVVVSASQTPMSATRTGQAIALGSPTNSAARLQSPRGSSPSPSSGSRGKPAGSEWPCAGSPASSRKVVGAPFERTPAGSSRFTRKVPSSPGNLSEGCDLSQGCASTQEPRTTLSSSRSIGGQSQRSSCPGNAGWLRRCRSASVGTRSVDSVSWEDNSQKGSACGSQRRRSPRSHRRVPKSRLSTGALSALESETLEMERQTTSKALQRETRWLRRALSEEMRRVTAMQEHHQAELERKEERLERQKQAEERLKERSQRHWEQSYHMKREQELQREQESQEHRASFEQSRTYLEEKQRAAELREAEQRERQRDQAEKRMELLAELQAKRQADAQHAEMMRQRNDDLEQARANTLQEQMLAQQQSIAAKRQARDLRFQRAAEANSQLQAHRHSRLESRILQQQMQEDQNLEKQAREREKAEEASANLSGKRSRAKAKAQQAADTRKSTVAEKVVVKGDKVDTLALERQKMRDVRREAQIKAQKILREAKSEVFRQSMTSRFNLSWLEEQLHRIENAGSLTSYGPKSSQDMTFQLPEEEEEAEEDRLSAQRAAGVDPSALHLYG